MFRHRRSRHQTLTMGWYLCYLVHRHLDFRRAEFQALAVGPGRHRVATSRMPFISSNKSNKFNTRWMKWRALCARPYVADLAGVGDQVQWRKPHGDVELSPFWHVFLPSEAAAKVRPGRYC